MIANCWPCFNCLTLVRCHRQLSVFTVSSGRVCQGGECIPIPWGRDAALQFASGAPWTRTLLLSPVEGLGLLESIDGVLEAVTKVSSVVLGEPQQRPRVQSRL